MGLRHSSARGVKPQAGAVPMKPPCCLRLSGLTGRAGWSKRLRGLSFGPVHRQRGTCLRPSSALCVSLPQQSPYSGYAPQSTELCRFGHGMASGLKSNTCCTNEQGSAPARGKGATPGGRQVHQSRSRLEAMRICINFRNNEVD